MISKRRILGFTFGIFCLALGVYIYLAYRRPTLLIHEILNGTGYFTFIKSDNLKVINIHSQYDWIVYSLPDSLWVLSYLSIMLSLWDFVLNKENLLFIILIPILAITSEFMQLFGLIPGTYDIVDIVFYALSTFISVMVGYLVRRFAYDQ